MIYRWKPKGRFVRIYLTICEGEGDPRILAARHEVWEHIKTRSLGITPGDEGFYWDTPEEEAEDKASWFESWDDLETWEPMGSICIDTHY